MFFQNFLQDIQIGLRVLVKEKGFCALAAGVLALGICAVTTQFAVVDGVLLRGVNFARADQLVDVQLVDPTDFKPSNFNSQITTADFAELKGLQTSYDGLRRLPERFDRQPQLPRQSPAPAGWLHHPRFLPGPRYRPRSRP